MLTCGYFRYAAYDVWLLPLLFKLSSEGVMLKEHIVAIGS